MFKLVGKTSLHCKKFIQNFYSRIQIKQKKTIRKKIENENIFSSFLIQTTDKQKTVTNGKFQHNFRLDSFGWIFFLAGIVLF